MAGKNLKVALEITADLNQARREVGNFREDIIKTSKAADLATSSQDKLSQSANQTANQIQKMSKATDMKAGVGELKNYEKQLDQTADASTRVAQANGVIEKSVKTLAPHFLALTAASGGFVALAVDTLNKAVDLQNLSNLSGMDVEQFQYYAAGAKTVSIQTEKLGDIFKDTRDKVGDFIATGGGELKDFFENVAPKVGVTAEQFKKLGGADALQLFFNTLKQANVSDNEMVFYLESIADEASALIPLLNNNGAEFKKLGDQAKASGAILDQEVVNNAKEAKAALGTLQNEIAGVTNQLVANAAPAITFLAENLDVLAQAGLIVASVYVARLAPSIIDSTKATIAELTAKGQSLFMSKARASALLAEATSAQAKTAADLRAAQTALAVASGSNAQAIAQARLTAARAADTAAILAQSRAQSVLDTTVSKSKIAAGALLGTLGGPVGLAITAAGVAASFLMMRDGSDLASTALQQHSKYAGETADSLTKLDEAQKSVAKNDLKESFELQNSELDRQARLFANAVGDIAHYNNQMGLGAKVGNELRQIQSQLNQGTISLSDALQRVNKIAMLTPEQRKQLVDSVSQYNELYGKVKENADAQKALGVEVKIAGNESQNQNIILEDTAKSAKTAATEVSNLSKAYKDLQQNTLNNTIGNFFQIDQINKGIDPTLAAKQASALASLNADPNSKQTYGRLPDDINNAIIQEFNAEKERLKTAELYTKEQEKQNQLALSQKVIAASTNEQIKNMLMVYQGFIKAGATDPMARYLTSEVGREGDFLNKNIFGSHQDKNNNQTNTGIISYQKTRSKELMSFLKSKGLIDDKGKIKQIQEAIEAQTEFALYELLNKNDYSKSKAALLNGQSYENLQQIVGNNFIGWDIKGNKLTQKEVAKAQGRQNRYKNQLDQILGPDPNALLGEFSKLAQIQEDFAKASEQEEKNRTAISEKYLTEDERRVVEYTNNRLAIIKAGFDQEKEMELLLAEDKRFMAEKNKSRLEMLKDVQTELISLDQNYLKANGQEAQAELDAIDEKYKDLKSKIETLLQSSVDPVERLKLEDAQLKLSVVIDKEKATAELNQVIDQFDKLQSLREQRQSTAKLQYESGQTSQFQYAEQLRNIDSEMKPALQNLIDQAAILAENMGDAFSVSRVEAMNAALNQTDGSFKKFLPTVDQIQERIAGGMTDAILDWADGTKSASDAFRQFASDFLREIAQMILKQMIFNAVKAASSAFGFAEGGFTGFASGGYTGVGGKYDPAGIVHKGEVVWSQEDIRAWGGVGVVESLRKHRGYADGGIVAAPSLQVPTMQMPMIQAPQLNDNAAQIAQSTSFNANQNFYLVDDPKRILDTLNSSQGQENIVVMMSRDPSKFKAALKIGG